MKLEKYLIELLDLRNEAKELRRKLDYDLSKIKENLLKDSSTAGKFKLLEHNNYVDAEEMRYKEILTHIQTLENLVHSDVEKISPNINDPLKINITGRTYINAYLDDNMNLVISDRYTQT